jgi:predicted DsbA family dithiol-disulfide isomerase
MPQTIETCPDFICPWYYNGLDRLTPLAKERSVRLHWNYYELRPDIPAGRLQLTSILSPDRLERAEAAVREATQSACLPLNRPELVPNFIFTSGRGFSGVQPYEVFLNAVDAAA